jgi:hypothetical protein
MNRTRHAALAAACALLLGACATAKFNATWQNPEAQALSFKAGDKVLAMVPIKNEGMRRMAEDSLARAISERGLQGVPSYTVIPTELAKDKVQATAKAAVEKVGAAGAVVMRVLAKDRVVTSQVSKSTSYTATWDGNFGWSTPYNPSDMRSDTVLVTETLIYDFRQDKLVWAGQSQTTNPAKVDGLIKDLADQTARQLRREGLVK